MAAGRLGARVIEYWHWRTLHFGAETYGGGILPHSGRPGDLAEESLLDRFAAYAHAGGHLVLGPRTGYADQEARARHEPGPARLVAAAGVSYDEFSNLTADLPLRAVQGSPPTLPEGATATRWVDGLVVGDATVLAEYDHPHHGRRPAGRGAWDVRVFVSQ